MQLQQQVKRLPVLLLLHHLVLLLTVAAVESALKTQHVFLQSQTAFYHPILARWAACLFVKLRLVVAKLLEQTVSLCQGVWRLVAFLELEEACHHQVELGQKVILQVSLMDEDQQECLEQDLAAVDLQGERQADLALLADRLVGSQVDQQHLEEVAVVHVDHAVLQLQQLAALASQQPAVPAVLAAPSSLAAVLLAPCRHYSQRHTALMETYVCHQTVA